MVQFVRNHRSDLMRIPTAFISVTLSEAGVEKRENTPAERARFIADVDKTVDKFYEDTQWYPTCVKPVAGALLYSKYNFFIRFIMKRIARKAGSDTDTTRDYDYTDWIGLDKFFDEFAAEIRRSLAPVDLSEAGTPTTNGERTASHA